ncbi:hmg box protein [Ophiostoma piceae UAMH 11346]|uniref:Hmg box protein n=1 Tax=Ophiostoma piceae (strain UAMH 11346) TaxID=1262450 RepID=S3C9Z6_OPHP1|nr:hmg box protein [Ophiostoma piceae UAMH 11346]
MAPAPATSPGVAPLPPSVEEAYRRKCVQLKKRMAEVEETNDAARIRLSRLKRQVEKQRLERAFLLEQLAKRTSTNVEDSDGSPSPPPTPKDKPLRTKRGHRKASLTGADGGPGASFASNLDQMSPTSDVFNSQAQHIQEPATSRGSRGTRKPKDKADPGKAKGGDDKDGDAKSSSGVAGSSVKRPGNAFELYCEEMRPALAEKKAAKSKKKSDDDGDVDMEDADAGAEEGADATEANIDTELARGWTDMDQDQKDEFEARAAEELAKYKKAKEEARQQKEKDASDDKEPESRETEKDDAAVDEDKAETADSNADSKAGSTEGKDKTNAEPAAKSDASTTKDDDIEMAEPDVEATETPSADKDA